MKTGEELNELKKEVENLNRKLKELSEEELKQVVGGLRDMPKKNPDEKYVMQILRGPVSSETV